MNPVVGLDIAKGESQVQAYLERKKPYKKSFKVKHDLDGLASLLDFIKEIEDISGERPHSHQVNKKFKKINFNFC